MSVDLPPEPPQRDHPPDPEHDPRQPPRRDPPPREPPEQDPPPLPYLRTEGDCALDLELEVELTG